MLVNRQEGKTSAKVKPGKKGVKEAEEEEKGEYTVRRKEAPSKASSSRCPKGCVWEYLCGPARGRPVGASLPERIPGGFCSFPRGPISRRCTFGSAGYPSSLPLLPSGCFLPLLFFFFSLLGRPLFPPPRSCRAAARPSSAFPLSLSGPARRMGPAVLLSCPRMHRWVPHCEDPAGARLLLASSDVPSLWTMPDAGLTSLLPFSVSSPKGIKKKWLLVRPNESLLISLETQPACSFSRPVASPFPLLSVQRRRACVYIQRRWYPVLPPRRGTQ